MALDQFMIAPFKSGLQDNVRPFTIPIKASRWYNKAKTKGCIMRKDTIDITGMVFGELTAIRIIEEEKRRGAFWECRCECGNLCKAYGGHLRAGKRKSCGCRSEARIIETGFNRLFSIYKRFASRRKKKTFSLSRETFESLMTGNCHYCNLEPKQVLKRLKTDKIQVIYNGIDRVDPKLGYSKENCVSCCKYCNRAKSDLTLDEWKNHIKRIVSWL